MKLDELGRVDIAFDPTTADDQRVYVDGRTEVRAWTHDEQPVAVDLALEVAVDPRAAVEEELAFVASARAEKR